MNQHHKEAKKGMSVGAFAVGALAGALAGVLLAPKSGRETRAEIAGTMNKMKDEMVTKLSELKELTQENYTKVVDSVVSAYEKSKAITSEQAQNIKKDLMDGYSELTKVAQETKDDMSEAA